LGEMDLDVETSCVAGVYVRVRVVRGGDSGHD
jgi:hypothetical protein